MDEEFDSPTIELVEGSNGIFDVALNDQLIFCKDERGIKLSEVDDDEIIDIVHEANEG